MEDIAEKIVLYHNLFVGCLALCVICIVVAIVLFFVLDIRSVWGYLTGRSAKRQIQQMEESSAASGRLMTRRRSNMQNMAQEIKEDMGIRGTAATPGARKVDNLIQSNTQPAVQGVEQMAVTGQDGMDATALLKQDTQMAVIGAVQNGYTQSDMETGILRMNAEQQDGATGILDLTQAVIGTFMIEKEIILIHAEEVI